MSDSVGINQRPLVGVRLNGFVEVANQKQSPHRGVPESPGHASDSWGNVAGRGIGLEP